MKKRFKQKAKLVLFVIMFIVFAINVHAQITYTSATQLQSDFLANQPYGQGTINQRILRIDITTGGSGTPVLDISKLNLSIAGNANIGKLTVIKASNTNSFPDLLLAPYAIINNPSSSESITLTGCKASTAGLGSLKIWILIDLKETAGIGTSIDVICESIEAGGITQTKPTINTDRNAVVCANVVGTKSVKPSGGDYATLKSAIADLNDKGMGSEGVTLVLSDDATFTQIASDYDHSYKYFRQVSSSSKPLNIKRSGTGTNKPVITVAASSSVQDCFLGILAADYVTIDGIEFKNTLTTQAFEFGILFSGIPSDGCCNNIIKNCSVDLLGSDRTRTYALKFDSYATSASGNNNNNNIFNNALKNADAGINFNYQRAPTSNDNNNNIFNNTITGNFGLETGAISIQNCTNTQIYGNTLDGAGFNVNYNGNVKAINTINYTCGGYIYCYNNVIKNITNVAVGTSARIFGVYLEAPVLQIYNNMISGLKCEATTSTSANAGIYLNSRNTLDPYCYVWNNSVFINQNTPAGARMTALYIGGNEKFSLNLVNNLLINSSTGAGINQVVFSQYTGLSKLDANSDNNLYYPEGTDFIQYSTKYSTISAYKTAAATKDQNILSELPPFVSATDLHLQTNVSTKIEGAGKPIPSVFFDVDNQSRNTSYPDLGADEGDFKAFNKAPQMDAIANFSAIYNNFPEQSISITGINDGNPSVPQNLSFICTSSNTAIIPNPSVTYVEGQSTAQLKFTPTGSGKGTISIKVKLVDNGGTDFGGIDSVVNTFTVKVLDPNINNAPTINSIANLKIFDNDAEQTINLTGIDDGDPIGNQLLSLSVSVQPSGILSNPVVSYTSPQNTGSIKFTPIGTGTATVTVKLKDDGGHAGESVDSVLTSFTVMVRNHNNYSFVDNFNDGSHNWWVSKIGQYSLSEANDNLKVSANKNEKWVSFGYNIPSAIDITEFPFMYVKLKPSTAEFPFKINAYIGDGTKTVNIQKRVKFGDSTYTELFFDFSGMTTANHAAINQILFAINGDALTWKGTTYIDQIKLGGNVKKSANICAIPDQEYAKNAIQRKIIITDIENANSLSISGGEALIQNIAFTAISAKNSTLTFDIIPNVTGKERVTLTATGSNGYENKSVSFWISVEGNKSPVIQQAEDISAEVNKDMVITLNGIGDGDATAQQNLSISAVSDNNSVIPGITVDYIQGQQIALLKFKPLAAAQNVKITVTLNDGQATENTREMIFYADVYTNLNNAPSVNMMDDINLLLSQGMKEIIISGIKDGDDNTQNIVMSVQSSVDSVIANQISNLNYTPGGTEAILNLKPLKTGVTKITITLTDEGGNAQNNGNQSYILSFNVNVLSDPLFGHVVPTANFDQDLANGLWSPQTGKFTMQKTTFDGYDDVVKVDMITKSNWDGIWHSLPEVNIKDNPYMSMEVYPVTTDLYWHVYFYDINGERNANGAHAQRKLLTKGTWNSIVLDYRTDGYLLNSSGVPINSERITGLLFNMHDKDFPFPFTNCSGTFYVKNIRVGDKTIFPNVETQPTIDPVLDRALILNLNPHPDSVIVTGLSNGNFSTSGITLTASSSNTDIANPVVGEIMNNGTAVVKFTPGTVTGSTQIILNVTSANAQKKDTFNITIVSNEASEALVYTVDTATKYQVMRGFGTFQNEFRFVENYTNEMGASAIRIGFIENQFEPINDNDDPTVTDYSKFNDKVFNWDYFRSLKENGVEDFILTVWSPPAWMKGNLSLDYMQAGVQTSCDATDNKLEYHYYDEFAEMIVAFCNVFKEKVGIELTGVGLQNEPAFHEPYGSAILDPSHFVQLIKVVGPRLQAEGLNTKIYMPEQVFSQGSNSMAQYIDALQADPIANQLCTTIAVHGYASDGIGAGSPDFSQWTTMWNNCKEGAYPKELWMTETYKDYKTFSDAMYTANALFGSLVAGNVSHWTTWSFQEAYFDMKSNQPTSMLYTTRNFAKYIRPGATRISGTVAGSTSVLGTSFINEKADGKSVVSVFINNGTTPATIKIAGTNLPLQYAVFQTTEALNCEKIQTIPVSGIVLLPSKSVTTLVGSYGNQAPLIDGVADITILNSDVANQTIELSGISDGDIATDQNITITAESSNTSIISNISVDYVQGSSNAILHYTHNGSNLGNSIISITVKDNGGINSGGTDSVKTSLKISVVPEVNMMPKINAMAEQITFEDATNLSIVLRGISDGDDLVIQPLTMEVASDNMQLISSISVDYSSPNDTGVIHYSVAPNLSGTANITLTMNDHGGNIYNNGDLQKQITFKIKVSPVNDAPTIDLIEDELITPDLTEKSITLTGITDGDLDQVQNISMGVTASEKDKYFSNLKIDYIQGEETAILRYTPVITSGSSKLTILLTDNGGVDNGGISFVKTTFYINFGGNSIENNETDKISLFPNPVSDMMRIDIPINIFQHFEIYDIYGKKVYSYSIPSGQNLLEIDAVNYKSGMYLLKLVGNNNNKTLNFIKE